MAQNFCGRCGAPLQPGAQFCGVCRTPVMAQAAAAYAQPYVYPYAQPQASRIGGGRGMQIAVAGGLVAILVVVAVAAGLLAYRAASGSKKTCTANCSPRVVNPLPAAATYRSTAFKYEVDYSDTWTVRNQDANGVVLGTKLGSVSVVGMKAGSATPDQVITTTVAALPSASWQSVKLVGSLKGAHLGDIDAVGQVYSANLIGSNSKAAVVRFAVIAATKGNVTVVVFAVDPADPAHFANGMPEGVLFDYMCTIFRWGG